MLRSLVVALQVVLVLSGSGHGGGEDLFEWAGIFETPEDVYLWTAQKTANDTGFVRYVDPGMKIALLSASDATEAALHALETEGNHALNTTCIPIQAGGILTPADDTCYQLTFKEDWWQSLFTVNAAGAAHIAFFAEHFPTEFENTAHYLKDDHGDDIEPVAELPEAAAEAATSTDEDTPWGAAIGASVLVNVVTLVGVIFLIPALSKLALANPNEFEAITSGLAAGALAACAFFLLLFEATHLVAVGQTEEVEIIWRWGTMILAGFLLPACIQVCMDIAVTMQGKEEKAIENAEGEIVTMSMRARAVGGVLIGDFFHNLCDGFFIGAAFKGCGNSFGWGVAGGTIAHEIGQEIADYFILTGRLGQLKPAMALLLNFLSGTSVLIGALIVCAGDVDDDVIGLILAFGGGLYLHIGATECMPRVYNPKLSVKMRAIALLAFVVGAIAIGLVLLDHEHCVPPTADGEPASGGHAHGH